MVRILEIFWVRIVSNVVIALAISDVNYIDL